MKGWLSNDTGWKITSLVLATLIWFAIKFGIQTDFHAADMVQGIPMEMTFSHLPITLLINAEEQTLPKAIPGEVTVTLAGERSILSVLHPPDIKVSVNLTDNSEVASVRKHVRVTVPKGCSVIQVIPADVLVERVTAEPKR